MTDEPSTNQPVTDHGSRTHLLAAAIKLAVAVVLLYPLAVGPIAFLHGAGILDDKAIDSIRPIYAPLKGCPAVGLFAGYERQFDALGRRLRK